MKKILFLAALVISFIIINNLIRSIYTLWSKKDFIATAQKELDRQKQKNQSLKKQLSIVNSREFIEKEARNNLFMIMPEEQKVLIGGEKNRENNSTLVKDADPNWRKWWNLFF